MPFLAPRRCWHDAARRICLAGGAALWLFSGCVTSRPDKPLGDTNPASPTLQPPLPQPPAGQTPAQPYADYPGQPQFQPAATGAAPFMPAGSQFAAANGYLVSPLATVAPPSFQSGIVPAMMSGPQPQRWPGDYFQDPSLVLAQAMQPPPLPAPPPAPEPGRVIRVPVGDDSIAERVQIDRNQERISLTAKDAPMDAVLGLLAEQHGLNIVAAAELTQNISVKLNGVTLEDALDAITHVNGYTWALQNNIITVTAVDASKRMAPGLQNRRVQVFTLNYVAALDVDKVVKGLLSPVGQSFTNLALPTDQRRTIDQLIVEDLPQYLERVTQYVEQIDVPPMQVVVEAQVLEVQLKDDYRHGVNFKTLARLANANIIWETVGIANDSATPASLVHVNGHDLSALLEFLYTTTDAKTLATPRVTALNGQMATIQIGAKLGYKTLQTTQTSTLQNVSFLDTGVILKVTPNITQDRQIMMKVKPSVSDGQIDPTSGLPNSNTTEVDTNVLLCDGEGIILGGLIKESDQELITKIPILGDIKYIGWMFRRVAVQRLRTEIIIALVPRIVSPIPGTREPDQLRMERVHTPLVSGPLLRVDRRQWEPELPQRRPQRARVWANEGGNPEESLTGSPLIPPLAEPIPIPPKSSASVPLPPPSPPLPPPEGK